ncbi:hypothetical protein Mapa_014181 [Marchantia paleacea]|nr:hypothetical protein Mapa_014181 [Marchantia paleacea]
MQSRASPKQAKLAKPKDPSKTKGRARGKEAVSELIGSIQSHGEGTRGRGQGVGERTSGVVTWIQEGEPSKAEGCPIRALVAANSIVRVIRIVEFGRPSIHPRTMLRSGGGAAMLRKQVASLVSGAISPSATGAAVSSQQIIARRGFAAGAGKAQAKQDDVQVPLPMYGVTGKYASALYVTAVRGNVLEPVEQELKSVVGAADHDSVFGQFMKDPSVPKDVRMKAIQDLFGKQSSYSDVTKNFLAVLAENGRLREIQKISTAYSELVLAHRGEVQATITAALELTPEELEGIKGALKGHLKPGQVLKVEQKVDRSIIGGIVVDILDKHIDLSIDTQIKQMEKVLAENL